MTSPELQSRLDDCLHSWEAGSADQRAAVMTWVVDLRNQMLALAYEVGEADQEDLELTLALRYIEFKSHWAMLNTKLQYGLFRTGELDEDSAYRASMLSLLIEAMEEVLNPKDIATITEFLANPISTAPQP